MFVPYRFDLNENWFTDLADARQTITEWQQDYNQARPHSVLGYRTPAEFAKTAVAGGCHPLESAMLETQNPEKVSLSLD